MTPRSDLAKTLNTLAKGMSQIPPERKAVLDVLSDFIKQQKQKGEQAALNFICTHNSRRSHFGQIWAATIADFLGLGDFITTYSGGTEATAFHPNAIKSLEGLGFVIERGEGVNPPCSVYFSTERPPLVCYSKVYDAPENPQQNFAAVMTCSEADAACPFIPGASLRIPLTYEDPKVADGTPGANALYTERSLQIATELYYAMQQLTANNE